MKDHVSRANWSVAAIGLTATAIIFWLAMSFWLDARNQRIDAANLLAVNQVEQELLDAATLLASARAAVFSARAEAQISRANEQLTTALSHVERLLAEPDLARRLYFSARALQVLLDELRSDQQALQLTQKPFSAGSQRAQFDALADLFERSSQLIHRLHDLQSGLRYQSAAELEDIANLETFRLGLRDLGEKISAEHATQLILLRQQQFALPAFTSAWQVSWQQVHQQLIELQALHSLQNPPQPLLAALDDLTERWLLSRSEQSIAPLNAAQLLQNDAAIRSQLQAVLQQLDDMIDARASASHEHGLRRLIVDTLLMVAGVWIVFASLRLVAKIRHQAYHDRLTNLPNRFRFEQFLNDAMATSGARDSTLSVAVLDVDNFNLLNHSLGHELGNYLLIELGQRLADALGTRGQLARLGSDEYAVVAVDRRGPQHSYQLIEELMAVAKQPLQANGMTFNVSLSAGLCQASGQLPSAAELIKRAELAMQRAKSMGKNSLRLFDPELGEQFRARVAMEVDLHKAIEAQQLMLHYQPKVNVLTGRVDGVEALLRWRHPVHGMVPPFKFIPIAESCGLIVEIGAWVLCEACRQAAQWRRQGLDIQVAVNVSAEQFAQANFVDTVVQMLEQHQLEASWIELEVTESVAVAGMDVVIERLHALRARGVSVAIDDFGTGFSSLQYLDDLPLDKLKIDRAFVSKIDEPDGGDSLVTAVVSLAKTYGLKSIAEGVETDAQLARLTELGCDYIQGYYYSKPVAAPEVADHIARIDRLAPGRDRKAA